MATQDLKVWLFYPYQALEPCILVCAPIMHVWRRQPYRLAAQGSGTPFYRLSPDRTRQTTPEHLRALVVQAVNGA